jgi:sulfatase maturation enzyme AslB (radical SAM superfamily)
LFGGEPTLYRDRLIKCLKTNKIHSISTNLLNLDDELISLYKDYNLSIATSWNPKRFTEKQYNIWLNNLKLLSDNNLSCIILITLTEDLLVYNDFRNNLEEWDKIKSVKGILFEPLLDYNMSNDLHQRADDWLCNLYNNWLYSFENMIVDRVKHWNCDCSDVWTLNPNGKISKGCPQNEKEFVLNDCLSCKLAGICNPCNLQHICSFPKKLYNKVCRSEML